MDPLSIIASIAGVSTAGVSLSRAIYDVISTVRNAPKEITDIARGLSDLSFILRELRRVLKDGKDIYRRKLIRRVGSAVRRVGRVQDEIGRLLDGSGGLAKLKWIFRKSKTMALLYTIESHKTGINMILHTMMLAVQLKQLFTKSEKALIKDGDDKDKDDKDDAALARQQAENMVQVSYHSLRELTAERFDATPQGDSDEENESEHDEDSSNQQVQACTTQSRDNAIWLYDLVFSTAVEATHESAQVGQDQTPSSDSESSHLSRDEDQGAARNRQSSRALILRQDSPMEQLRALAKRPPAASTVVNELLSEWTTLTEDEIEGISSIEQKAKKSSDKPRSSSEDDEVQMVMFEDAIGRKFELPFHLIREWIGIEELIKQMFLHVDVIGPRVQEGHYDLMNSKGSIILPQLWKYSIKPTESYTMHMWPEPELPKPLRPGLSAGFPRPGPPPPPPPTFLSRPGSKQEKGHGSGSLSPAQRFVVIDTPRVPEVKKERKK
ncbi:hypothetical protein F5Y19DRAFT_112493 [Xylariaceae sp. FL1651]|nr:hypothetical protein F5Y19DRAFT_112493 [Xylariaceae sp. FL1651]